MDFGLAIAKALAWCNDNWEMLETIALATTIGLASGYSVFWMFKLK
jgi:hypothetical protein